VQFLFQFYVSLWHARAALAGLAAGVYIATPSPSSFPAAKPRGSLGLRSPICLQGEAITGIQTIAYDKLNKAFWGHNIRWPLLRIFRGWRPTQSPWSTPLFLWLIVV